MSERWVEHINKEGARFHVLSWSNLGQHCSEPRCEVNRRDPPGTKRVRMSDELFHQLGAGRVEWGEPDAEGFYTPTVFTQDGQQHLA